MLVGHAIKTDIRPSLGDLLWHFRLGIAETLDVAEDHVLRVDADRLRHVKLHHGCLGWNVRPGAVGVVGDDRQISAQVGLADRVKYLQLFR